MAERSSAADWALFELAPGATLEELQSAYRRLRALYGTPTLATYALLEEEERRELMETLDAAFGRLLASFPATSGVVATATEPRDATGAAADTPGRELRRLRERGGVSLADIARRTKIRPAILEALEGEVWDELPAPVFVRGFVLQVARYLRAPDPEDLSRRYLARMPPRRPPRGG